MQFRHPLSPYCGTVGTVKFSLIFQHFLDALSTFNEIVALNVQILSTFGQILHLELGK